jgi:polyadenylate-binding protein
MSIPPVPVPPVQVLTLQAEEQAHQQMQQQQQQQAFISSAALVVIPTSPEQQQQQKHMIGQCIYPLVHNMQPALASKITGMLLELDNSELLSYMSDQEALSLKVQEAVSVLNAHSRGKL